jgi:3(or 17)beta-hydroxysteroid dehydrogenase
MDRVKGKIAIITGGGSGIGKASAILLAKEGAKVVVTDIVESKSQEVARQIIQDGGESISVKHDVTSEDSWKEVIQSTMTKFGKLNVLVNNAGVVISKPLFQYTMEEWRQVMSVDLDGVFLGIKHGIQAMIPSGGGSIINMSSTAGIVGIAYSGAYSASKGGVRALTKTAALECSKAGLNFNIRVNSIHPGVIKTPMTEPTLQDPGANQMMLSWHPIGHFGEPEDIAYGVLYLASDESKFITGAELVIDGGWTAQ